MEKTNKQFIFDDLYIGQYFEKSLKVTEELGSKFADISYDYNPIHLDDDFANKSRFGEKIVHGMLIGSYFSGIIGNEFPGRGSIYINQELIFKRPVHYDTLITLKIEIIDINVEKHHVMLSTQCRDNDNLLVDGKAKVLFQ